jgi:hypothetical protein
VREETSGLGRLISTLFGLYFLTIAIAVPYYNWQYANQHGLLAWLAFGELVPTAKALVWPYFALHKEQKERERIESLSPRQINEMNLMSVRRAIDAAQQGNYIINSRKSDASLTPDQIEKSIDFYLQSLQSADTTDEELLNKLYPEFGTRFKRDFCEGERLFVSGIRNRNRDDLIKSRQIDQAWQDWYMTNRERISDAFNKALQ